MYQCLPERNTPFRAGDNKKCSFYHLIRSIFFSLACVCTLCIFCVILVGLIVLKETKQNRKETKQKGERNFCAAAFVCIIPDRHRPRSVVASALACTVNLDWTWAPGFSGQTLSHGVSDFVASDLTFADTL